MRTALTQCALSVMLAALVAHAAWGADERENPDNEIWARVRANLFGGRSLVEDDGTRIRFSLPARAADAAAVPLSVRVEPLPGEPAPAKLYLVIDRNPSPIAGIFEFGPGSGGTELETRVRIEDYTWVRAIAEAQDGSLVFAKRFVKAAGGCSAPAGKKLSERLQGLGQMKWRVDGPQPAGRPIPVLLMIRHPNNSGLAMDQLTRFYDPAYYVRSVKVTRNGEQVFAADVDFSISENPAFRFTVRPGSTGALHAEVVDTNDLKFESDAPAR
ncbi:MAG TPA: quinoprotein dehydrogenase-associated SoxYZ-like carrier [Burkholderiales bacterium]|nr:quinoprotein dehydrogenase-associated SoxYZ-like carrier [Burkholderiales bacterium]